MDIFISLFLTLLLLALFCGLLLGFAAEKFKADTTALISQINACLPQTQCAQCGYPGCKPYAEAIASGEAINKCPPGGEQTIAALATLLDQDVLPLDASCGEHGPAKKAVIREQECIGCTFCLQACPVDAIVGAPQQMHTIISSECTGCELCLPPCPVDCIDLVSIPEQARPAMPQPSLSEQACIRCGFCVDACPVDLLPQELLWSIKAEAYDRAEADRLHDCIECGLCHAVCPSHIPLVQYYQLGKSVLRLQQQQASQARHAEQRFQQHEQRLARLATEAEQQRAQRSRLAQSGATQHELIQAALDRAKARQNSRESGSESR